MIFKGNLTENVISNCKTYFKSVEYGWHRSGPFDSTVKDSTSHGKAVLNERSMDSDYWQGHTWWILKQAWFSFIETNSFYKPLYNRYQILNLNPLKLDSEVEMDQSDLQLYSLDKDLVDSQPKANQNLTNLYQNFPLGSNSNKASLEYRRKACQNFIINQNLKTHLK